MPDKPQRPFVPHRTPHASHQTATNSEFQLTRPFIPGGPSMPPIGDFLAPPDDTEVSIVYAKAPPAEGHVDVEKETFDELPPVEHFTDPLPPAGAFASDEQDALADASSFPDQPSSENQSRVEESGWIEDDWQQYDWRAAAALGDAPTSEASNEWATTDWEVSPRVTRDRKPSAAEAIASALDEIAQRIRKGDVAVPAPETLSNPAAVAASLAALLGVKR